ncbi:MAG: biliverdin-producing heme oxygenase [Nocardioidaceae bacterium]|nr:biliverdin-producing heme oxygenase [Nocardioidaceae bacterium]
MTATVPEQDLTLSAAMREGSRTEHEAAESTTFMAELLDGRLTRQAYADLLLRMHSVYAALEQTVGEHRADPVVAAVYDPALERLAAIEADLRLWAPGIDPESIDSPAVAAYVARIHAAGAWGGLLVAHHYTRYLGDLSGGQVIGRVLQRTFDLPEGRGVDFYEFPAIPKPKPYKDGYRARLDGLGLTPAEVLHVVEEVKVVFTLNQGLFNELGERLDGYRAA